MRRKRLLLAAMLVVSQAAIGFEACATAKDPKVRAGQNANSTITVLGTLADAVANAADQKLITVAQAHQVLDIIKAANNTLVATPEGGFGVAVAAVDQIEAVLTPDARAKIGPYLVTTRAALEVFRNGK